MVSTFQYLSEHGIKPSVQRAAIMSYLLKYRTHPTVDEVYRKLLPQIPTLSKTTVYNTLNLFVEQGVAVQLDIDERNVRFDGTMEPHAHFRCKKCGCIVDVPFPEVRQILCQKRDFTVEDISVNVKGICKACKSNSNIKN
ncbi:MAG: transcriptional repressor [Tannerella sp.]|jgi:Fur family peroxide stress response transcriptional regulator|nr:transcriptional repressor [Tannerella sp.]